MVKLNDVYKKVEDKWVSRSIMDEVVIMPLCRSEEDMQYIYSISNETGSKVWQLLDGEHSVRDIQEVLKSEYEAPAEKIEQGAFGFIRDVLEAGLIEREREYERRRTRDEARLPAARKKAYMTPEIAKVKMQPEQAVLTCCQNVVDPKEVSGLNWCAVALTGSCNVTDAPGYNEAAIT